MSDQIVFQISTPAPSSVDAITTRGSKIDLLATNIAAIDGVYDDINGADNVGTVAADLLGANYTGQVGGNIANVNKVAAIDGDVSAVAVIDAEVVVVSQMRQPIENISDNLTDILAAAAAQRDVWIETYGATAVTDGTPITSATADSAAAIEAALATGLRVRAGAGQFRVSRTIQVAQTNDYKDAFIVGSGEESTTFVFDNGSDDGFVFETTGIDVIERDRILHGIKDCSIETRVTGGKAVWFKGDDGGVGAGNATIRIAKNLNISGHAGTIGWDYGVFVENCTFPKVSEIEFNGTGPFLDGIAVAVRSAVPGVDHRYDNITGRNCEMIFDGQGFGEGYYLTNPIGIGVRRGGQAIAALSVTERSQPLFHVLGGHVASRDFGWKTENFTHTSYHGCTMLGGGDYWTGVEIVHTNQDQPHVHDLSGLKMSGNKSAYTGTKAVNLVGCNGVSIGSGAWSEFDKGVVWNDSCADLYFGQISMTQVDTKYTGPHTQASWYEDKTQGDSYRTRSGRIETLFFSDIKTVSVIGGQAFAVNFPIKMSLAPASDYKVFVDQTGGVGADELNTSQASETYAGIDININAPATGAVRFDMSVQLRSPERDAFHLFNLYDSAKYCAEYDYQDLTSMRVNRDGSGGYPVENGPVGVVLDKSVMQGNTAEAYLHGNGLISAPLTATGNHMIAPSDIARPLLKRAANGRYYLQGDGTNTSMEAAIPGPSDVTYVTVLDTSDALAMLLQDNTTQYVGAWENGSASTDIHVGAGTPAIRINGSVFAGTTRNDLDALIAGQGVCVVSVTSLTLTGWASINEMLNFAGDRYASWLGESVSAGELADIEDHYAYKFDVTLA